MPTVEEIRSLEGADVAVHLTAAAGGETVEGRVAGTLEAADGLVVFIEPADRPGARLSYNYQHIATIEPR
jgi:putative protein kinase ArgK-like GTPase of G3E family